MKLLVTGAAGDFGQDLVPLLAEQHEVTATDLRPVAVPCEFVQADLLEAAADLVCGIEAVVHLAARLPTHPWTTREYWDANAVPSAVLMEAAAAAGVDLFIYTSTVWVTGHGAEEQQRPIDEDAPQRPICTYGLTKLAGELAAEYFARTTDMRVIVLRMCGYDRCPEIAPDGAIDWMRLDWPHLVFYMTRSGQKLFDPLDLLDVYDAALRLPDKFGRYVVGQQWPFGPDDAEMLQAEPERAWAKYYPQAEALFRLLGVNPPELHYYYDVAKFVHATAWRQRITMDQVARRYLALHGDRL